MLSTLRGTTYPALSCRFIPLLGELLDCPHTGLRCAATDVLIEIVSKRMEPTAKISLVQQLKVVEACERLSTNLVMAAGASKAAAAAASSRAGQGGGDGSSGSDGSAAAAAAAAAGQQLAQDEELLAKYAKLLATLAGEVMDALKRIENGECGFARLAACSRLCNCPLALRPEHLCLRAPRNKRRCRCTAPLRLRPCSSVPVIAVRVRVCVKRASHSMCAARPSAWSVSLSVQS